PRALAGRQARGDGPAPGRDPARLPPDHRAGRAAARGARRRAVRHGRDPGGAAAHLARRRPVRPSRPPHGRPHRLPDPRPAAVGDVNFLDLVIAAAVAGAAYLGYRVGFIRRVASWTGLAVGIVVALLFVNDVAQAFRGSPPRTRLLVALGFVLVVATVC